MCQRYVAQPGLGLAAQAYLGQARSHPPRYVLHIYAMDSYNPLPANQHRVQTHRVTEGWGSIDARSNTKIVDHNDQIRTNNVKPIGRYLQFLRDSRA